MLSHRIARGSTLVNIICKLKEFLVCAWGAEHLLLFVVSFCPIFPFLSLSHLFYLHGLKFRCSSNQCFSEKVQLVLQSSQEILRGAVRMWGQSFLLRRDSTSSFHWWLTNEEDKSERVNVLQSVPGIVQRRSLAILQLGQRGPETLCRFVPLFWSFPAGAADPIG